jgi:nitrogen fixation NifU-like protein
MNSLAPETVELYRELISDHTAKPRNFREIKSAKHRAEGHNRLCGDRLTVWANVSDGVIVDVSFKGSGCSIGTSSASMMTEAIMGIEQANKLFETCHALLTSEVERNSEELGKLVAFAGVKRFPVRVKCATLPWHTLIAAIDGVSAPVSTEVNPPSRG